MILIDRYEATRLATPAWVDTAAIARVYEQARELTRATGIPHDVDHEIPLRAEHVTGLHVPWNLVAIPTRLNWLKNNRIDLESEAKRHMEWLRERGLAR